MKDMIPIEIHEGDTFLVTERLPLEMKNFYRVRSGETYKIESLIDGKVQHFRFIDDIGNMVVAPLVDFVDYCILMETGDRSNKSALLYGKESELRIVKKVKKPSVVARPVYEVGGWIRINNDLPDNIKNLISITPGQAYKIEAISHMAGTSQKYALVTGDETFRIPITFDMMDRYCTYMGKDLVAQRVPMEVEAVSCETIPSIIQVAPLDKKVLEDMINQALDTRDEEWFMKLTEIYNAEAGVSIR